MLYLFAGYSARAELVGHWEFDDNLLDSVGGNNGTVIGDSVAGTDNGISGGAVSFDGSGDAVYMSVSSQIDDDWSILFWAFDPEEADNTGYMVSSGYPHGWEVLFLRRYYNDKFAGGVTQDLHSNPKRTFGELGPKERGHWYHHTVTHNGTTNQAIWYINGEQVAESPADFDEFDSRLYVGNRREGGRDFKGLIDDLRLYNHTLDQQEIDEVIFDPKIAIAPYPINGSTGVATDIILSWLPSKNAITHNVYFGINPDNLPLVSAEQAETFYDPCGLLDLGTYYWRIDEIDPNNNVWTGNVWVFTVDELNLTVLSGDSSNLLYTYLEDRANEQFDARDATVQQALQSLEGVQQRQQQLNADYRKIVGYFPEKVPLNPVVTGTIEMDDYRIEKVAYQSRPGFYVTANLYVPTTGSGPWPGVLVVCGHSSNGKAYTAYQNACILLAKNGFVVLIVDPLGAAERYQIFDDEGNPIYDGSGGTTEHTIVHWGAVLVGSCTAGYEIWDNFCGIDYLLSRPEVDTSKSVGFTGNSGGGNQTMFAMPLDDRIGPMAPSCFISSRKSHLFDNGPQDGCQHIPGEGAFGIEEVDYITMRAPKPTIILAAEYDFFRIEPARETYSEAQQIYSVLGEVNSVDMFEYPDGHGFHKPRRQAMVRFMRQWLWNDSNEVIESDDQIVQSDSALQVTVTGQVGTNWCDATNVIDLNLERACGLFAQRKDFWENNSKAVCIDEVKTLIGLRENLPNATVEAVETIDMDTYSIEKLIIKSPDEVPIPGLLFLPNGTPGQLPATIYVDSRGKDTDVYPLDPGGPIINLVQQNHIVLSIDVRGFGETVDNSSRNDGHDNEEYTNGMLAQHLGRPLLGQRTKDVLTALDVLLERENVDPNSISITGIEKAGPVVLHAAAIDVRFTAGVTAERSLITWLDLLDTPLAHNQITHIVPFALTSYDLQDIIRSIAPRPVQIIDPVDAYGNPRILAEPICILKSDTNEDGIVDTEDLLAMSQQWVSTFPISADINGDGIVDFLDFVYMANEWFDCTLIPESLCP
ncbi:MAG: hypothetical protein K8R02_05625 [Anaerohalosphaeraceae bacterium]|nr:hypothetical protein [Anaerohalosphaeraceae bacterium]